MSFKASFHEQAKSDHRVMLLLLDAPHVEPCHWLHYLQMATEKVAKAYLSPPDGGPPKTSHQMFVRLLRFIPQDPVLRKKLGFRSDSHCRDYLRPLLPIAEAVERLAPAVGGPNTPNCEYPWKPRHDRPVVAPASYPFDELNEVRGMKMARLLRLVERLLGETP